MEYHRHERRLFIDLKSSRILPFVIVILAVLLKPVYSSEAKVSVPVTAKVGILERAHNKYKTYANPNICRHYKTLLGTQLDRSFGEIFILCEAFAAKGYLFQPHFISIPNVKRGLFLLDSGQLDLLGISIWSYLLVKHDFYSSAPVLLKNEFEKGIYVTKANLSKPVFLSKNLNLSSLTGITNSAWEFDLYVLNQLTDRIMKIGHATSLLPFVMRNRADFLLLEFPSSNALEVCEDTDCVYPIPGVKVVFPFTRHMGFSKQTTVGKTLGPIFSQGLKKMREHDEVRKIYNSIGFFNHNTRDWTVMNSR